MMVPLMLQEERGMSPFTAGIALTGGALTWSLASWLQGREVFSRSTNLRLGSVALSAGIVAMGGP
ncbi:hypothetical protein ACFSTC_07235 [Nonomuraea ferruginea]